MRTDLGHFHCEFALQPHRVRKSISYTRSIFPPLVNPTVMITGDWQNEETPKAYNQESLLVCASRHLQRYYGAQTQNLAVAVSHAVRTDTGIVSSRKWVRHENVNSTLTSGGGSPRRGCENLGFYQSPLSAETEVRSSIRRLEVITDHEWIGPGVLIAARHF